VKVRELMHVSRKAMPEFAERIAYSVYRNTRFAVPIALRKVARQRLIVIVGTAHKVGSTWLFNMVRDLGQFKNDLLPREFMHSATIETDDPQVFHQLMKHYGHSIYKTHSYPISYALKPEAATAVRFLSMYRDPRDVIVSASFYLANLDPNEGGWDAEYRSLPTPRRIEQVIERGGFLLGRLSAWFRDPTAIQVRYESTLADPQAELTRGAEELGLDRDEAAVARVVKKYSFKSKSAASRAKKVLARFCERGSPATGRTSSMIAASRRSRRPMNGAGTSYSWIWGTSTLGSVRSRKGSRAPLFLAIFAGLLGASRRGREGTDRLEVRALSSQETPPRRATPAPEVGTIPPSFTSSKRRGATRGTG